MTTSTRIIKGKNKLSLTERMRIAAKTDSKRVHVIYRLNGWAVKMEKRKRAFRVMKSKPAAIALANNLVNNGKASRAVIHDENGNVLSNGL